MRNPRRVVLVVLAILLLAGCDPGGQQPDESAPVTVGTTTGTADEPPPVTTDPVDQIDVIFYNGTILTMDEELEGTALAVLDERIEAVGSDPAVRALAGPGTMLIDLDGRTLMPGFVDGHSHFFGSDWRHDLEAGQAHLLSIGITTTAELTGDEGLIQELQGLDDGGRLRARVSVYPTHVDNCGNVLGDWYSSSYPPSRESGAMLQFPGVKMFNDGGSCNAPAVSFQHADGSHGDLYFEADDLAQMVMDVQDRGYQAIIHGLGDRAVEAILGALAIAKAACPQDDDHGCRHRIEHSGLVRDDMLSRYSEVDPVAMIFGGFPACFFNASSDQYKFVNPDEYRSWEWRWRSLIDTNPGVHFAWHSDTPPMGDPNPMRHIHGFLTRKEIQPDGTVCEPPDWAVDDRLTVEEALTLMTIESAYSILREEEIGSLRPGKLADLIILSESPFDVEPEAILEIQVLLTMVGGKGEHCLGEYQPLCN